jgi:large repetitive protein
MRQGLLAGVAIVASILTLSIPCYAESIDYVYDDLHRLIRVYYGDGTIADYTYDEVGNRTEKRTYLDTTPPTTTASPPGGIYNSGQSVSLVCDDGTGSGCDNTHYSIDGSPFTVYSSPINISQTTTLQFYSTDLAGHSESLRTETYTFDTQPPSGSITINSGASATTSVNVTLTLTCSDTSGCSQMRFSNDGSNYSAAEAYSTTKAWTLATPDGNKTVYAMFKDTAGNWSTACSDAILLDTTLPTGTVNINSGATCTNTTSVTLTLTCNDANGCSQMQFSNDGSSYSTAETFATTKAWTLTSENGTRTVYAKLQDSTGNWSNPVSDTIALNSPVIIVRTPTTFYTSLGAAYIAATTGDTIRSQGLEFIENLAVNRDISVTLEGGYDCGYTTNAGNTTSIKEMVRTYPGGGTITIRNVILEK